MRVSELETLVKNIDAGTNNPEVTEILKIDELKSEKLAETLCAFANQDNGGFLLFCLGADPSEEPDSACLEAEVQKLLTKASQSLTPPVSFDLTSMLYNSLPVTCAFIHSAHPATRPVFITALGREMGSFKRKGAENLLMEARDRLSYRAFSTEGGEELRPVLAASVSLLKGDSIQNYLTLSRKKHPEKFQKLSDEDLMDTLGITLDHLPTLAGYLIFSDHPQSCFPGLSIMASSITPGSKHGPHLAPKINRKQITGSLPDMLQETVSFLLTGQKWLKEGDYPMEVVREAILNALLHRDYSRYSQTIPIQVAIYQDRIEITNSGAMKGNPLDAPGAFGPNNKTIAEILETLELTRNNGSGIQAMKLLCKNAKLPEPEYVTDEDFTTVILRRKQSPLKLHPKKES